MESQRSILIIGLLLVSFLLWTEYQQTYGPKPYDEVTNEQAQNANAEIDDLGGYLDEAPVLEEGNDQANAEFALEPTDPIEAAANNNQAQSRIITVTTDTLDIKIDLRGGDVIEANLIKFPVTQGSDDAYELLKPERDKRHVAQSFLLGGGGTGPDKDANNRAVYTAPQNAYELTGDTLEIPLTLVSGDGLEVTKVFTFSRASHLINVEYQVTNNRPNATSLAFLARLEQTTNEVGESSMFMPVFRGTAYSSSEDKYEKLSFGDIADENLNIDTPAGWVAMIEHYFVAAWVPPQDQTNKITARLSGNNAIISVRGQTVNIPPNEQATLSSQLYVGPKNQERLAELADSLDLTVDYGPLWWLSQWLFELLKFLHGLVANWGVAIILITLIVKGAMYWLTKKQYESMAKMRNLQPKMTQLKDRFGDDRQKMSQAMMELYKKEKVNPMGGCFPLLLQMPIFLALYWVLLESVELRHAGFALWITDLSVPDPFFVLPILTGLSMFLLQRLQPMTIQDPLQQKLMQYMPVAMSLFFFLFPAGLVLYWLISNLVTLVQAKIIYASMEKRGLKSK